MVRLQSASRVLLASARHGHGLVGVSGIGHKRQLWFQEERGGRLLQTEVVIADGTLHLEHSLRQTPYLNFMFKKLRGYGEPSGCRVLVLGVGGGLLPQALVKSGCKVIAVESSEVVLSLARKFMGLQAETLELHSCDAASFVRSLAERLSPDSQRFDACAIDIFQGHTSAVPAFTRSQSFLQDLKQILRPGALLLQNAVDATSSLKCSRSGASGESGAHVRCTARVRQAAPMGPLKPVTYVRHNEAEPSGLEAVEGCLS
ncbi:unnamed protein product [Cladocopium goreaui]|uniref:Spermine/spermidine synthase n=1 Tax=Cladocopium goreaui TaxID=2562237 RepID=A0A9P1BMZ9_9DINO|nr:unnamed protein product [Cladocopium goreaui]